MKKQTLLLVDDSPTNLYVLEQFFDDEDHPYFRKYELVTVGNGQDALALLEESTDKYDAVLLDIMMPGIDGLEVLSRIKKNEALKTLPVILQTARAAKKDIEKGLKAGAFYYLTKPVEQSHLLAIVRTAVDDNAQYKKLENELKKLTKTVSLIKKCSLEIQTLDEAYYAAVLLSKIYPDPEKVVIGLSELMLNAIEHGNLGISYDEKTCLVNEDSLKDEVVRRLSLPENSDKRAIIEFESTEKEIRILIKDQGKGFDWHRYTKIDAKRAMDNHGRGIAIAGLMCFDTIEYLGVGNEVLALKKL